MDEAGWDGENLWGRYYYRFWEPQGPDLFLYLRLDGGGHFLFLLHYKSKMPSSSNIFVFYFQL